MFTRVKIFILPPNRTLWAAASSLGGYTAGQATDSLSNLGLGFSQVIGATRGYAVSATLSVPPTASMSGEQLYWKVVNSGTDTAASNFPSNNGFITSGSDDATISISTNSSTVVGSYELRLYHIPTLPD